MKRSITSGRPPKLHISCLAPTVSFMFHSHRLAASSHVMSTAIITLHSPLLYSHLSTVCCQSSRHTPNLLLVYAKLLVLLSLLIVVVHVQVCQGDQFSQQIPRCSSDSLRIKTKRRGSSAKYNYIAFFYMWKNRVRNEEKKKTYTQNKHSIHPQQ